MLNPNLGIAIGGIIWLDEPDEVFDRLAPIFISLLIDKVRDRLHGPTESHSFQSQALL